jgi:hypothetical protein
LVASLVFVGFQFKQDREIARVEIYQSHASTVAETLTAAASNSDAMLAHMQSQSLLALADNSHFQYQEGFLPEDHWLGVRATLKKALR